MLELDAKKYCDAVLKNFMKKSQTIVKSMKNGPDGVTSENAKQAFSGDLVTRGNTDFELFHYNADLIEFYPQLENDPVEDCYLWSYFATTGMLYHACQAGFDYFHAFKEFIDGLAYYRSSPWMDDTMVKYHSARGKTANGGHGDCFFDDNIWVARNLLFAYELLGDIAYLEEAQRVVAYVYTGWNNELQGLVWNERGLTEEGTAQELERGLSANACSILVSAKLYIITADKNYLDWAHRFYNFCKTIQDPNTGIYYNGVHTILDNGVRRAGDVNKDLYAYNSGSMILANLELYKVTEDAIYLEDAIKAAKATHIAHLRNADISYYHDFTWFFAVYMEGCYALGKHELGIDCVAVVFDTLAKALNYAKKHESPDGLLPHDYVNGWRDNASAHTPVNYYDRVLLTHSGTAEIIALVDAWYRNSELR